MTFQQIYTELTDMRFNTQAVKLAEVKRWVNAAELAVWNAADWVFKRKAAATLAVTIGGRTPTMPADFGRAYRLYTDAGLRVDYREPDLFEELYPSGVANGTVQSYTVIDRAIHLGPAPATAVNFKLAYEKRYTKSVAGTPTLGVMSGDTDTPIWDAEHHYVLVPWAMILGMKLENDPTGDAVVAERDMLLQSMIGSLVEGVRGEVRPPPGPLGQAPPPAAKASK